MSPPAVSLWAFSLEGEGTEQVPRGPEHLILRAMAAAWEAAGVAWGEPGPGLRLETANRIPHSRGLGSSASAIVAGVCAADALLPEQMRLGLEQILQVCSRLEGHPDNVAPSLYGGLVVSWEEDGVFSSARIPADPRVTPVAAVPDYEVPTKVARGLIPAQVPHGQAAMTAGRAALLVHAVGQAPELLFPATRDGLHQQYRACALAPSAALLERLRAEGFPAIISGAGPTVLVLAESPERARDAQEAVRAASEDPQQRIEGGGQPPQRRGQRRPKPVAQGHARAVTGPPPPSPRRYRCRCGPARPRPAARPPSPRPRA